LKGGERERGRREQQAYRQADKSERRTEIDELVHTIILIIVTIVSFI